MSTSRIWISPRFTAEKLAPIDSTVDDCIDVYADRVNGWLLEPAAALLAIPHGLFAAMHLCLGYFEGWAKYHQGLNREQGSSRKLFKYGLRQVFPVVAADTAITPAIFDEFAKLLYEDARCGAFHTGFQSRRIRIHASGVPIILTRYEDPDRSWIATFDPAPFVSALRGHFDLYVTSLRDPANSDLREKFTRHWNALYPRKPPLPLPEFHRRDPSEFRPWS